MFLTDKTPFSLTHPCNSLHAPCHSPHTLKGQKLLAQGIRPGYSCPHAWRPVGAKALYGDPNMIQYCVKLTFNRL